MPDLGIRASMLFRLAKRVLSKRVARTLPIFRLLAVAQVALLARTHLQRLTPDERRRLASLVRRGRSLSPEEKEELRTLSTKIDTRAFVGAAADKVSPVPLPRRLTGAPKDR